MIFISHTHTDKDLVEPIAHKISSVFGQESVFYDSWSIQPGDGIIDKMDEALSKCKFFFFFVSKKSLSSKMVKLEWQNALLSATKGNTKIIPVKLDDCLMPQILLQTLYIDVFGQGIENAVRQMIDVISGRNIYRDNQNQGFQNIRGYVSKLDAGSLQIEFKAEAYMEPHSNYLILVENNKDDLSFNAIGESQYLSGFANDLKLSDGSQCNAIKMSRMTATSPGFSFVVKITPKENKYVKLKGLMRAVSKNQFAMIPVISINSK